MAVEIRELVIKAVITSDEPTPDNVHSEANLATVNQQIIQECVSQVLKIIKQGQNR